MIIVNAQPLINKKTGLTTLTLTGADYVLVEDSDWNTKEKTGLCTGVIRLNFDAKSTRKGSFFPLTYKIKGARYDETSQADIFEFADRESVISVVESEDATVRDLETALLMSMGVFKDPSDLAELVEDEDGDLVVDYKPQNPLDIVSKINECAGMVFKGVVSKSSWGWTIDLKSISESQLLN